LNFGNELVTPITFECDGGKANFSAPGYSLIRLNSGCNWSQRRSVKSIWAFSSSEAAWNLSSWNYWYKKKSLFHFFGY